MPCCWRWVPQWPATCKRLLGWESGSLLSGANWVSKSLSSHEQWFEIAGCFGFCRGYYPVTGSKMRHHKFFNQCKTECSKGFEVFSEDFLISSMPKMSPESYIVKRRLEMVFVAGQFWDSFQHSNVSGRFVSTFQLRFSIDVLLPPFQVRLGKGGILGEARVPQCWPHRTNLRCQVDHRFTRFYTRHAGAVHIFHYFLQLFVYVFIRT